MSWLRECPEPRVDVGRHHGRQYSDVGLLTWASLGHYWCWSQLPVVAAPRVYNIVTFVKTLCYAVTYMFLRERLVALMFISRGLCPD